MPAWQDAGHVYDGLWAEAQQHFAAGQVQIDPYLLDIPGDHRLGISLVMRPDAPVASGFTRFIDELRQRESDQHYYRPAEYHVTFLSVITVACGYDAATTPVAPYDVLFKRIFAGCPPLRIRFCGVTASPSCVLVQGFTEDDTLNDLRDLVRRELLASGLACSADARYRLVTSHATLMRFRSQPRNLPALQAFLTDKRDRDFGTTTVDHMDFVVNDWFMTQEKVQELARYRLG